MAQAERAMQLKLDAIAGALLGDRAGEQVDTIGAVGVGERVRKRDN